MHKLQTVVRIKMLIKKLKNSFQESANADSFFSRTSSGMIIVEKEVMNDERRRYSREVFAKTTVIYW